MNKLLLLVLPACLLLFGCKGAEQTPEVAALGDIPAALHGAFQDAEAGQLQQAQSIARSIKTGQFSTAAAQTSTLLADPNLSRRQKDVLSQALPLLNQEAQKPAPPASEETAAADQGEADQDSRIILPERP